MNNEATIDEKSFKLLVTSVIEIFNTLWNNRFILLFISGLGFVFGIGYAQIFKKVTYTSQITFVVEERSSSGGLTGIASQFGFNFGSGGGGGNIFSSENLTLLLRSQKILVTALFEPIPDLNNDILINAYLRDKYSKSIESGDISLFKVNDSLSGFTRKEDSVIGIVVNELQAQIEVSKADKRASIIILKVKAANEIWAFSASKTILETASRMYADLKIGKTTKTLRALESKVDSVKNELETLMGSAAIDADQNQGLVLARARVSGAKKQMQIQILTAIYGELIKNLETTRFALEREEPVIQIIDEPVLPLVKTGKDIIYTGSVVSLLTLVIASIGVVLWNEIKKLLV